jgi:hypothetical protein
LLLVVGSIRNVLVCQEYLPQDVGCGANDRVESTFRSPSFNKNFHLLAVLPAKQTFSPEFRQTSPTRIFLQNVMTE